MLDLYSDSVNGVITSHRELGCSAKIPKLRLTQTDTETLIHVPIGGIVGGTNGTNGAHVASLTKLIQNEAEKENMSCIDILLALENVKRRLFFVVD